MKNLYKIIIITLFMFMFTGCLKTEELDKAEIYTTTYPIEYLVNELYGYNSKVLSIYPDGANINKYTLSNKKIKKYSKTDLFVYNGLTDEKKIAASFVNKNSKLKIIDVTEGLAIKYSYEELWLNPINYLMLAQNVKNGLKEYIDSPVIKDEIDKNYDNFKVTISEFETNLKLLSQNAKSNVIIVSKNYFKFLENYGFEVISVEETEDLSNDTIKKAKDAIKNKENNYVFVPEDELNNYSNTVKELVDAGAEVKKLNTMTLLTSKQRENKDDYITLMKENIENLKEEAYK